jgi:hypothetical protein
VPIAFSITQQLSNTFSVRLTATGDVRLSPGLAEPYEPVVPICVGEELRYGMGQLFRLL